MNAIHRQPRSPRSAQTLGPLVLGLVLGGLPVWIAEADSNRGPSATGIDRGITGIDRGIQVKTLEDGTQLIYNENTRQRARRHSTRLLPVPSDGMDRLIRRFALENDLSPRLVQAVVQVESGYNPKALSSKGAMGLMQLMPDTARLMGVTDPWDPGQNIRGGTRYLRRQLDRFQGSLTLALAAYNAGPTAVTRYGGVPPYRETRNYVDKVLGLYEKNPPQLLRDYAREQERIDMRKAQEKVERERSVGGSNVYVTRDANNNIVFTTEPPGSR